MANEREEGTKLMARLAEPVLEGNVFCTGVSRRPREGIPGLGGSLGVMVSLSMGPCVVGGDR
jgi:hypothetical protein